MKSPFLPIVAAASLLALAACNSQPKAPEVVDANPDPMANALKNAAPIEMPPAIKADKSLRCKDNSLVYVTFFQGDKLAMVRTTQGGTATKLTAPTTGAPLTAAGWKLTGGPDSIELTQPGKAVQSCKS
ncbi:hypothetical protein [uncultured Sphingomonas sp.]|uniref:hypothetical protein n=1 Tax=uncultured Sphingomonas sp. TaxID=158754 RepID=UPI0035C9EF0B